MLFRAYNSLCMLDCLQAQYVGEARYHFVEPVAVLCCYMCSSGLASRQLIGTLLRRRALLGVGVGLGAALASALLARKVRAGASKNQLSVDYYKCGLAGPQATSCIMHVLTSSIAAVPDDKQVPAYCCLNCLTYEWQQNRMYARVRGRGCGTELLAGGPRRECSPAAQEHC